MTLKTEVLFYCQRCREPGKTLIHHKDGNHDNDVPSNRERLCQSCHSRTHVDMRHERGLPLGTRPTSDRTFEPFPRVSMTEVKKQYFSSFPRA